MRAALDIAVATASALATMAVGLLVVPVYLRLLGVEAYGLVGFLALLQSVLQLLDLGLAPTIGREVASAGARGSFASARPLLGVLARFYWATGLALGVVIVAASPLIATYWLKPASLSPDVVKHVVMLIGAVIAFRWPTAIYSGALIGARRLSLVSLANLAAALAGSLGGVALVLLRPDVEFLFAWYAVVALMQLLVLRRAAWRLVGYPGPFADFRATVANIWRFSVGMGAITLCGITLSQLDRLLVSRFLSLEAFGIYTVATVAGRALYGLITPMYNIISPRFTALYETGGTDALQHVYRQWTTLFCGVFLPATMAVAVAARPLVLAWTGDPAVAAQAGPLVSFIVMGSGFHSVMFFPFAIQIAAKDSRTPLVINLLLLLLYVPLLIVLVMHYGAWGAALSWMLVFATYVPLGAWITHRTLLPGMALPWLAVDVGVPLMVTASFGLIAWIAVAALASHGVWMQLVLTGMIAGTAVGCNAVLALVRFQNLREQLHRLLRSHRSALQSSQ